MEATLGGAFLAGLLSFLSPCVLPLVPPYLSFLAGASLDELAASRGDVALVRRTVGRAAAFVLGFATVFVALGASASMIGQILQDHLPLLSRIAGALVVLFGLHFLGVLKLPFLYGEARYVVARAPTGLVGAFAIGLAFAFGWTPCVGPVLASILFVASAEDTATQGATLLASYSMGIGVPFLLAAAFVGPFLMIRSRLPLRLDLIEKAMGLLLVAAGLLIMTGSMADVAAWLLETFPALGRIG